MLALVLALGLLGFYPLLGQGASDAELAALRERATAFWQARTAGDTITQYQFETLSIDNEVSLQTYVQSRGALIYHSAEVVEVTIGEDGVGEVTVAMKIMVPAVHRRPMDHRATDVWVKVNGKWYHTTRKRLDAGNP
ncbi:MAG: hypothetical protein ACFCBW_08470 [Candidatus Competibacterales bacterium]